MQANSSNSSSSSTTTATSHFTTTTIARPADPATSAPMNFDVLVRLVNYIDRLETLHAMAATCKDWHANLQELYQRLRKIGSAQPVASRKLCEQVPLPASKTVHLALFWLGSRLLMHRRDESEMTVMKFTRGVVTLIGRHPKKMRVDLAKSFFPILKGLSKRDWERLLEFAREGMNSDAQLAAFRLDLCKHPNARDVFFYPEYWNDEIEDLRTVLNAMNADWLIPACGGDPVLEHHLFEVTILSGNKGQFYRSLLETVRNQIEDERPVVSVPTCCRLLKLKPPSEVCVTLLEFLLNCRFPAEYYALVLDSMASCVTDPACVPVKMLELLCAHVDFVDITSKNKDSLKKLVRAIGQFDVKLLRTYLGEEIGGSLIQKLNETGVASPELVWEWAKQDRTYHS